MLRFHKAGHKVAIVPEPLTVYSGAHRGNPDVEAQGVKAVQRIHGADFSGSDKFSQAFQAALEWKTARIELEQQKVSSAATRLALVTVQHPVDIVRYVRSLLSAPVRRFLSGHAHPSAYQG